MYAVKHLCMMLCIGVMHVHAIGTGAGVLHTLNLSLK